MEARPWLAREEDKSSNTPMHLAVRWHKSDVLRARLEGLLPAPAPAPAL
jgi:hypothetical protein